MSFRDTYIGDLFPSEITLPHLLSSIQPQKTPPSLSQTIKTPQPSLSQTTQTPPPSFPQPPVEIIEIVHVIREEYGLVELVSTNMSE